MAEVQMETVAEIFDKIMLAKAWNKKQLAEHIGIDKSILSQKLGTEWNQHWRVFVKLLPILIELKIIRQEHLYVASDNDDQPKDEKMESNSLKTQEDSGENTPPTIPIMLSLIPTSLYLQ